MYSDHIAHVFNAQQCNNPRHVACDCFLHLFMPSHSDSESSGSRAEGVTLATAAGCLVRKPPDSASGAQDAVILPLASTCLERASMQDDLDSAFAKIEARIARIDSEISEVNSDIKAAQSQNSPVEVGELRLEKKQLRRELEQLLSERSQLREANLVRQRTSGKQHSLRKMAMPMPCPQCFAGNMQLLKGPRALPERQHL